MGENFFYSQWKRVERFGGISLGSSSLRGWFLERSWVPVEPSSSRSVGRNVSTKVSGYSCKQLNRLCVVEEARFFLGLHLYHYPTEALEIRRTSARRVSELLKSMGFIVSCVQLHSDRKNARKYPPRRRYALVSFHPGDAALIRQIYPVLYECLEPYLCRPILDHNLESTRYLDTIKNRVCAADFFIPIITSAYKSDRSVRLDLQLSTAKERMSEKGAYWIFPLIFDSVLDGDLHLITQKYTGMMCNERFDPLHFRKELRSMVRMIFETWQVCK